VAEEPIEDVEFEEGEDTQDSEVEEADSTVQASASDEDVDAQIAAQPFRVVYQTNNFLLPQLRDLIIGGDVVNLRPEYQRRLRLRTY
jgi:hypothetical protein